MALPGDTLVVTVTRERPGIVLNIPQCIGQTTPPPKAKNYLAQNIYNVKFNLAQDLLSKPEDMITKWRQPII